MRAAFARILLELRKKRKLKQEDVAFASGYSTKYISQLERRVNTPTLTAVLQISVALHTDPLVMIGEPESLCPDSCTWRERDQNTPTRCENEFDAADATTIAVSTENLSRFEGLLADPKPLCWEVSLAFDPTHKIDSSHGLTMSAPKNWHDECAGSHVRS